MEPSRRARETRSRRGEPSRDQNHTCRVVDEPSRIATKISKAERRIRRGEIERRGLVEESKSDEESTDGDAEESHPIETHEESPRKARETRRRGREGES